MPRSIVAATLFALCTSFASLAHAQLYGAVTLAPGFMPDPQRLAGVSGGPIQAQSLNPSCRGWISQQPNHALNVTGGFPFLRIFVESQSDTTLVIRAPNGQFFCNDDTWGLQPDIDAAYGPGQYLIWVGSYSQTNTGPYQLAFSELRTSAPAGSTPSMGGGGGGGGGGGDLLGGGGGGGGGGTVGSGQTITVNTSGGGLIYDYHTTSASVAVRQSCTIGRLDLAVRGRHTFNSDMIVRLRGPTGDSETLQSHANRSPFRHYSTTHFNGEDASGTWTLSIEDSVGQDSGYLNGFTMNVTCQ